MEPKFKTERTLTEADFLYLYRTNLIHSQGPKFAGILVVITAVVAVIAGFVANKAEKSPTFAVVLALIVIAAFCAMIIKNLSGEIKRIAANQIAAHEEKHPGIPYIVVTEVFENEIVTGLSAEDAQKTSIPLSDIGKVIRTKQAVICTTKSTGQSLLFQADAFTKGTLDDFTAFITEAVKK